MKRIILRAIVAVLVLVGRLAAYHMVVLSRPAVVTISPTTTYITAPLRADGYVDSVAAIDEMSSDGVTPENNSAVLFWQAIGPKSVYTKAKPNVIGAAMKSSPRLGE